MKQSKIIAVAAAALLLAGPHSFAEIKIVMEHNDNDAATPQFKFKQVPAPAKTNAASNAKFTIIDGEPDDNSGGLDKLHDGKLPTEQDQPEENFFFNAGTEGGRLLVDLGKVLELSQVNTYSWHPDTRGPQVYQLYASDGKAENFKASPKKGTDPAECGWKLLVRVDTRKGQSGGQYGVSIFDSGGALGQFRYLLFNMARTEADDDFGNTFYSEINVIEGKTTAGVSENSSAPDNSEGKKVYEAGAGKYRITIDTSRAPDLTEWANEELAPVVQQWYPKLVQMLPSEGYEAPTSLSIVFQTGRQGIPAATGGTRVTCNKEWFSHNLKGEAKGAVIHELVHVVQQYHHGPRSDPNAVRPPGWLVEGIPDYLRWFKYEPESHGADLPWMRTRRNLVLKYDGSYRISANFLNWVSEKYPVDLVQKLNAALRGGKYNEDMWKQLTGHTVQELGDEWKKELEGKLAEGSPAGNTTTTTSQSKT